MIQLDYVYVSQKSEQERTEKGGRIARHPGPFVNSKVPDWQ